MGTWELLKAQISSNVIISKDRDKGGHSNLKTYSSFSIKHAFQNLYYVLQKFAAPRAKIFISCFQFMFEIIISSCFYKERQNF